MSKNLISLDEFDITKTNEFCDQLFIVWQLELVGDHKLPSEEEIEGR